MLNGLDVDRDQPQAKRTKAVPAQGKKLSQAHAHHLAAINKTPVTVLTVWLFGDGENAELGLGPKQTGSLTPRVNPFLDPKDPSKFHVVELACGGMHTVALTADDKIVTWGVNDSGALGRDTSWDGGLRDVDADSDDEEGELNPLESTPGQVPSKYFEPPTRFAQVAAGDNCTFVLTSTGLLYGWGTFRVRNDATFASFISNIY